MSSYRQALKAARTEHIRKLIDNNQNNPRFLFSTVARLTNNQTSPDLNIPSQFNSNDFMNFFTDKIVNIRNTITNVDSTASSTSASFTAPKEKLQCFSFFFFFFFFFWPVSSTDNTCQYICMAILSSFTAFFLFFLFFF